MAYKHPLARLVAALLILIHIWPLISWGQQQNKPADMCASINTASMNANISWFQTQGLCTDFCNGQDAAFAIVQYQSCWCSDYVPDKSTVVDNADCGIKCPAFFEWCGGDNAFGYINLGKTPSGTLTGPGPSLTSGGDNAPTKVETVTADGTVRTITSIPSSAIGSPNTAEFSKKGPNTGMIVGVTIAIVVVIVIAVLSAVCYKLRRRQRRGDSGSTLVALSNGGSSAGMAGTATPHPEMGEMRFTGPDGKTYVTTNWDAIAGGEAGDRRSRLMPADPRMDPYAPGIYARTKSHESINTLHDDADYSRRVHQPKVLRATNPDPEQND